MKECPDCKPLVYERDGHRFEFVDPCPRHEGQPWDAEREEELEKIRFDSGWSRVCPPDYRDTMIGDPRLHGPFVKAAREWNAQGSKGLGLVGESGLGKTRCTFHALLRAHMDGRHCHAISHNEFSNAASEAATMAAAREKIARCRNAEVLLIDDIGKGHCTERAVREFGNLVEYRVSRKKPLLWSSQAGSEWMRDKFGPDSGPQIVRRLAEFCKIVNALAE